MFSYTMLNLLSAILLIIIVIPDVTSYNKYGRTCKDIGCRSDETCVMAEDPCTGYTDRCGRYPTCQKTSDASCTSMVCGENEYCKSENGMPRCVKKSTGLALLPGLNQVSRTSTPRVPSPPPRSSSYGGRYSGHSGSRNTIGDGSIFNRLFGNDHRLLPTSFVTSTTQANRNNYYTTHTRVDNHGNRIWTFSENNMRTRTVPKRQTSSPTETETHGSSDASKNSDSQSNPARTSGYSSGLGYPSNNGYPSFGSSRVSDSTNQPRSGYPSSDSSGYPSSSSSSYPSGSGYPSNSGYPSSGRTSHSTNQPQSGYPFSGSNSYPSSASSNYPSNGSPGYPSGQSSGYPPSGTSGYPSIGSSNYPSRDNSGYPTRSEYPGRNSGSSGYPGNSGNSYNEETIRRTGTNIVNSGYPSYPQGNPLHRGNYPIQNTGYPYNNQYPSNQGYPSGYPQNYPQGGYYPAGYQGQNYMTTTKRPGIRDQLTNIVRNAAEKVLTQTILDRITGRH